ncbi:MAG TPA: hypothetical protein VFB60_25575 [Ktedonobacteraceae bacterium]|nr:hypothetical protein [Ktedonobacteraceae bacterium]
MNTLPRPDMPEVPQPARDSIPRRLIVTATVVAFAIRDWSLWVLLRDGPWGPPMRLVLGSEAVTDAVERTLDALLLWPDNAPLVQLKAGWQEQQVHVWGSTEQGAAISLIHSMLLRANRDELRPNLHAQPVPSLHVRWLPVAGIESGQHPIDPDVQPSLMTALYTLRSLVQREPEIVLRFLADMGTMRTVEEQSDWWKQEKTPLAGKDAQTLSVVKEPAPGDGTLTLAEATLLYRAFFSPGEQIDLSNLRRRFLATGRLEALNEERPVRGRELDWRRVSRAYRYLDT